MTAGGIIKFLSQYRLSFLDEKDLQRQIEEHLIAGGISHTREARLDDSNIVDFLIAGNIAMEIKIKGSRREIYKQCERYCSFDNVSQLILVTNRSMGFPKEINRKPCYVMALGKAWL